MPQDIIYDGKTYTGFDADWRPHRKCSDFWLAQGLVHESGIPEAAYAFHLSLMRINAGLESFLRVDISLSDLLHGKLYASRLCLPYITKIERFDCYIDEESIICGQQAQVMLAPDGLALRLRGEDFGVDLRLDRMMPEIRLGSPGEIFLTKNRHPHYVLRGGALPHLKAGGCIYTPQGRLRVEGTAGFEHYWGQYPLKRAAVHSEHFYLFFERGDQIMINEFPYGGHRFGHCFPLKHKPFAFDQFEVEAVEYTEVDDWRFSAGWRLRLPQYSQTAYYLAPLIPEAFRLPVCCPVAGVFDKDGNRLGYAVGQLMPGARNEVDKIPFGLFME